MNALEINFNVMGYINSRFSYLLTYLKNNSPAQRNLIRIIKSKMNQKIKSTKSNGHTDKLTYTNITKCNNITISLSFCHIHVNSRSKFALGQKFENVQQRAVRHPLIFLWNSWLQSACLNYEHDIEQ